MRPVMMVSTRLTMTAFAVRWPYCFQPRKPFYPQITQISTDKTTGNPELPSDLMGDTTLSGKALKICVNLCNLRIEPRNSGSTLSPDPLRIENDEIFPEIRRPKIGKGKG